MNEEQASAILGGYWVFHEGY